MEYIIIKEAHSESQDIILPELITDETSSIFTDSNLNHQSHQTEDVKVPVQYSLTNTSDSMKPNKYLKSPNAVYDSQIANIELAEIQSLPTKIIHTKREKRICCAYCSKTFPSQSKMLWHQRMHEPDRPRFSCPSEGCDRTYISRQSCELHYKQMHCSRDEFQPLECMLCHKKFAIPQTLEVHMRYHTRQFPFGCSQCERRFAQKGHLTSHMQVKHNNLRYICPEEGCGKVFKNTISLRNHSFSHTGMPFRCTYCNRGYPQKSKLKVHLKVKHEIVMTLEEMESMRKLKSTRTRHSFVKLDSAQSIEEVESEIMKECLDSGSMNEHYVDVLEETTSDVIVA